MSFFLADLKTKLQQIKSAGVGFFCIENAISHFSDCFSSWQKDKSSGEIFYKKTALWVALLFSVASLIYFISHGCSSTLCFGIGSLVFFFCYITAIIPTWIAKILFDFFNKKSSHINIPIKKVALPTYMFFSIFHLVPTPPAIPRLSI